MSLTYSDVVTYLTTGLAGKGYSMTNPRVTNEPVKMMPMFIPGPVAVSQLQKLDPGPIVFLGVGGGPGFDVEQLFDGVFITVRTIGQQADYADSEALAIDIDTLICKIAGNGTIGTTKVLYATRTGGRPQLIDFDNAERYHFQCSYVTQATTTGLVS